MFSELSGSVVVEKCFYFGKNHLSFPFTVRVLYNLRNNVIFIKSLKHFNDRHCILRVFFSGTLCTSHIFFLSLSQLCRALPICPPHLTTSPNRFLIQYYRNSLVPVKDWTSSESLKKKKKLFNFFKATYIFKKCVHAGCPLQKQTVQRE